MKQISHIAQALALWFAFALFRLMGPDKASALGGWIGRNIGPRLGASRKARANLEASLPDADLDTILRGMWDNLGRVIAEYPHLKKIVRGHTEIVGEENLKALQENNSFLVVSGHTANWELGPLYFNLRTDMPIAGMFREPNNPYAATILARCRNVSEKGIYIAKSQSGARSIMRTMQAGGRIGILIDQKYNQGIPVEFFGRPAMTSVAIAQLALKFNRPIVPLQVIRTKGCNFRIVIHPPYEATDKTPEAIMLDLNRMIEGWIRERPDQWLWLHRRWSSKALKSLDPNKLP